MFIETIEGRLQNVILLQDVIVIENDDETYSIGYVQVNGEVIKEGEYNSSSDAESERQNIYDSLLAL